MLATDIYSAKLRAEIERHLTSLYILLLFYEQKDGPYHSTDGIDSAIEYFGE